LDSSRRALQSVLPSREVESISVCIYGQLHALTNKVLRKESLTNYLRWNSGVNQRFL